MELYLKWLEKNEVEKDEEKPIGLILCAEGKKEQIELLELDSSNIKDYIKFYAKYKPNKWQIWAYI